MTFKSLMLGAGLLSLAACSGQTDPTATADKSDPPNILWIMVEDVSPWMSAYGDDTVETPALDKMAADGVTLMNVFAPNPICSPTRSALMTGKYPTTTGVHNHRRSRDTKGRDAINLPKGEPTLPEVFQQNGYATFNIGKDDYNFVYDRRALFSEGPDGIEGHIGEWKGPDFDWTKLAAGKPFFGQIQLKGGKHNGLDDIKVDESKATLPPYYPDTKKQRDKFYHHYKTIIKTDQEVTEILTKLETTGEADNTAVFFVSDHGMGMLRHKQFIYDGGVHVPIIISYPNGKDFIRQNGVKRQELMSLIDLSAAALEIADIPVPGFFEARPIFSKDAEARRFVPLSRDRADYTFEHMRGIRTANFKYIRHKNPQDPYMMPSYRDGQAVTKEYRKLYKAGKLTPAQAVLMAPTRPAEELFDIKTDPHEINNLADDPKYAGTLKEMRKTLDTWIKESGDKGQIEETETEIAAVVARWGEKCTDKRCVDYVAKYGPEEAAGAVGVITPGK